MIVPMPPARLLGPLLFCILFTIGCGATESAEMIEHAPINLADGELLQVVASTSIVADVVDQVGGDHIELVSLMPAGTDPHGFQPTPSDLIAIGEAHAIFINGLHLEESLEPVLTSSDNHSPIVAVNDGVQTIELGESDHGENVDPHTWFSIRAVEQWVENIQQALSKLDPANGERYKTNAQAYLTELDVLRTELDGLIAELAMDKRKLVTNHDSFGYFAAEYDFNLVGTIIPSLSTMASPTAGELAALQDQIEVEEVPAIFVGAVVNPGLAEQLAADMNIQVVTLYTGALSNSTGPANNYVDFMRYNVTMIVEALK